MFFLSSFNIFYLSVRFPGLCSPASWKLDPRLRGSHIRRLPESVIPMFSLRSWITDSRRIARLLTFSVIVFKLEVTRDTQIWKRVSTFQVPVTASSLQRRRNMRIVMTLKAQRSLQDFILVPSSDQNRLAIT